MPELPQLAGEILNYKILGEFQQYIRDGNMKA